MNGVIWSKIQKTFVPIFSVPAYVLMQQERLRQSRALETQNFKLQNLTLTSFQEPSFFEFYDNDTKVSGLCGELWTLLSKSLNFTLQPVRANVNSVGIAEPDHTFKNGLLGIIFRNETIAIPKVETYSSRLGAADFTMPLWINSQRLYIRHEEIYDDMWMIEVFSWQLWCTILIMYVLLSVCVFWSQNLFAQIRTKWKKLFFGEHFFNNFGLLCNQGIPEFISGRAKILKVSMSFFSYIIYAAFSAVLFTYMTRTVFIPPFDSLDSLATDTDYNILTMKGSLGDIALQNGIDPATVLLRTTNRVIDTSSIEEMLQMACTSTKEKYAIFQGEDEYKTKKKTRKQIKCHLMPTGESYFSMWIASAIAKNFKHKRTIDLGILRLKEVGLWNVLTQRWLTQHTQNIKENIDNTPEAIGMDQVSLIIAVICCGMIAAVIILIIENIYYDCFIL